MLGSSSSAEWLPKFRKIDGEAINCYDVIKRSDSALGIMDTVHTLTDVRQQMELSLDTIVFGSQLALKSTHFYNSVAIGQLERWTIKKDYASTLAVTLKKEIKGLHDRTS